MSGLGRSFADLELRNSRAMAAGQARWDNMAPPEPTELDDLREEALELIKDCEKLIGRAQRAMSDGNFDAARDLLIEAGRDLALNVEAAWEREE